LIINTSLTDTNIGSLITLADAEMIARGLDEGTSNIKKLISMLITASLCALRDPASKSIGEYTEAKLNAEGWRKLAEDRISCLVEIPFLAVTDPVE
jgi:hypothetical protein